MVDYQIALMRDVLEFDSVELSFDGRRILSGVYMQCRQGEVVGLLGKIIADEGGFRNT